MDKNSCYITGRVERVTALNELFDCAEKEIEVFDKDLRGGGYESLRRASAMEAFLLRNQESHIVFLLQDVLFLQQGCPRVMALIRRFPGRITVREVLPLVHKVTDTFVLVDAAHYLHRFHRDQERALLAFRDVEGARELSFRLGEILNFSEVSTSVIINRL